MPPTTSSTTSIDDRLSNQTTKRPQEGLISALIKGVVSAYRGATYAPHTLGENSYDSLGADVAPSSTTPGITYTQPRIARMDPRLTPEALKDFYEEPEVSHGVIAGRTKYVPLAERREAEAKRKLAQAFDFAYYRRHR